MAQAGLRWERMHPAINAMLNGTSAVFLAVGWVAIRRGDRALHQRSMVTAFATSSVFLASYLIRFATTGAHRYPGAGWDKTAYLLVLFSHMVLAVAVVPLVLRSLQLAWRGRFAEHRRVVRWAWPVWMYVSVTGVLVYLMLYQLGPALH
jgi:putative membrane protein